MNITNKYWILGVFAGLVLIICLGIISYSVNEQARINREADVRQAEVKAQQTQERWNALQRLPFLNTREDR